MAGKTTEEQLGVPEREAPYIEEPPVVEEQQERIPGLPENFDSVEALAKSYQESRAEMARAQQARAADAAARAEAEAEAEQLRAMAQQQYQPSPNDFVQQYQDALDSGDAQRLLMMNAQLMQVAAAQWQQQAPQAPQQSDPDVRVVLVNQEMRRRLGESWDQGLGQRVSEYAQQNHWMIPPDLDLETTIERLTEMARIVGEPQEPVQQGAQGNLAKRQAQTLSGGNGFVQGSKSPEDIWIENLKRVTSTGY